MCGGTIVCWCMGSKIIAYTIKFEEFTLHALQVVDSTYRIPPPGQISLEAINYTVAIQCCYII